MAYKKDENQDARIQRLLDVLNLSGVNKESLDDIYENYLGYPTQLDEGGYSDLIKTLEDLRSWAHSIAEDPIKNASSANELAIWCSEQNPLGLFVGGNLTIQVDKPEDGPSASIEDLLAKEILSTFLEVSFDHLKCCHQCNKYFLSFRSNARYCSIGCIRKHDRLKNGPKYVKAIRSRRKKGIYIPKRFFLCRECRVQITKASLVKDKLLKNESVRCKKCNTDVFNPYHLLSH